MLKKDWQTILALFLAVLVASEAAASERLKKPPRPSAHFFESHIVGAYALVPYGSDNPSANDIAIKVTHKPCEYKLIHLQSHKVVGTGIVVRKERSTIYSLSVGDCSDRARTRVNRRKLVFPECSGDRNSEGKTHYLLESSSRRIRCLYVLDANGHPLKNAKLPLILAIRNIYISRSDSDDSESQRLAEIFNNAPYWRDVHDEDLRAMACNRYFTDVGTSTVPWESLVTDSALAIWKNIYLVKTPRPFRCGDAIYTLDTPREPLAYLDDGSALLAGERTVIQVNPVNGHVVGPRPLTDVRTSARDEILEVIRRRNFEDRFTALPLRRQTAERWWTDLDRAIASHFFN